MGRFASALAELTDRFVSLHARKEDLFWVTKMGLADDAEDARLRLAEAEIELNRFLQDPDRLAELRRMEATGASDAERSLLRGWIALLAANVLEDPEARALSEHIVEREGALERARMAMPLGYADPATGSHVSASSVRLTLLMRTHPDEAVRRAAFEALRSVETYVIDHGFLEVVRLRNRLARTQGYEDYYAWRLAVVEGMSKERVFGMLRELADRTRDKTRRELHAFRRRHGEQALEPWNFSFLRSGELARQLDPYFRFDAALERWGRSFHALGVRYRQATLTLDLVDRPGKYENGFMHGPGLAFYDGDAWRPARINFTATAVPGQPGSGLRATQTLFHEGGHAAHFSNILTDAPCFSHEFAPTSVAYAETQSMFMDSLLGDADWQLRYARDANGQPIPMELVEAALRDEQPWRGWDVRARLTVPMAERAIYEIPDAELTADRVLDVVRRIEHELTGLNGSVRPVLAVPHLLAGESSAYYHAYILAEMAVHQTRRHFLERDGFLADNPRIGPDLARTYWAPGNTVRYEDTLRALTGQGLRPDALVDECNLEADEAIERARHVAKAAEERPLVRGPVDLDATIRVVHGRRTVATTEDKGFEAACEDFARWVRDLERSAT